MSWRKIFLEKREGGCGGHKFYLEHIYLYIRTQVYQIPVCQYNDYTVKKNSNFKLTAHMWIKNLIFLEFLFLMKNKLEIRFAWKYIMFRYTMNRGETREEYAWYLIIVPWDMDLQAYLQKVAKICKLYQ